MTLLLSLVQSLNCVWLFVIPWTAAHQASLSVTKSWSLLKLMSIDSVMPSNHLIHCGPLLLLPSIFPSISVFPSESVLCIRWSKYWSFNDCWRNYCLITYCLIIIKKRLLLNLCDIHEPGLQVHNFEVDHSLCSFSDAPVSGRLFAWWLVATNLHLKFLREYHAPGIQL